MLKNIHILQLFKDIDSQVSENKLIEISYKIAIRYLRFNFKKVSKFLETEELTIEEFALDAIASLFVCEKKEQNISIYNSFINWSPAIENNEDALFFLNKIVANRVEQHLYSILREEDPFFSKILDSVNYLVKSQGFSKSQAYGKSYIIRKGIEICGTSLIDHQEFERIPTHLFTDKKKLIPNLLNYLSIETNFCEAIPLNELIYRLKHINFSEYVMVEVTEMNRKQYEIDEIINLALNYAFDKLNKSYCEKGKLNEAEVESIRCALGDICEDLKNGGINPGLYQYLQPHISNLTKEVYQTDYHNILEYLFKITKSIIAENLIEKK